MAIVTKEIPLERNQGVSVSLTYLGDTAVPDISTLTYSDGSLIGEIYIDRVVTVTNFSGTPVIAADGLTYEVGKWDMGKEGGTTITSPLTTGETMRGDPESLIHVVGYIQAAGDAPVINDVVNDGYNLVQNGDRIINTIV